MSAGSGDPTVAGLLRLRARKAGERLALAVGTDGRSLTYAGLARRAAAWAAAGALAPAWSRRAGLAVGDPLAFATTYLSLLAAGVTVAPLDPDAPGECARLAALLELDLLVTDLPDDIDAGGCPLWHLGDGPLRHAVPSRPHPIPRVGPWPAPGPPAVLLSSSGTTGTPKIVPLAERQLLSVAGRIASHHRLGPAERGYSALPLFHVNAQVVGLLAALAAGSGLVVDRRFRRTDFWALLDAWEITWLNAVPAMLAILADLPGPGAAAARRLRFARSASAPLPGPVQARFEERSGVSVLETYGMTEAASQVTANPLDLPARRPGSAGLPVGPALRVVDGEGRPCAAGATGSIEIRGQDVVRHYVEPGPGRGLSRNPSIEGADGLAPDLIGGFRLREARNAAGWLVTGDVGHLDERGYLFLTGRADDVINCGGEKIYPREIEELLRTHPAVTQAVVVGQRDGVLGRCPVAYVTAREGIEPARLAEALMRTCESRLGRSRRPRRLVVVEHVPTGPTGKVRRRLLERESAQLRGLAAVERSRAS